MLAFVARELRVFDLLHQPFFATEMRRGVADQFVKDLAKNTVPLAGMQGLIEFVDQYDQILVVIVDHCVSRAQIVRPFEICHVSFPFPPCRGAFACYMSQDELRRAMLFVAFPAILASIVLTNKNRKAVFLCEWCASQIKFSKKHFPRKTIAKAPVAAHH